MKAVFAFPLAAALTLAAIGCNTYDPDLGIRPFRCGTDEPRCPAGYVCVERSAQDHFCEAESAFLDGGTDSGPPCRADAFEPNQTIDSPTVLPIPEMGEEYSASSIFICPESDVDVFRFRIDTTGKSARIEVSYPERGDLEELVVNMLNSAGVSIRAATPVDGDKGELRADFANLAEGDYYAEVKGAGDYRVEYSLHVLVTSDTLPP